MSSNSVGPGHPLLIKVYHGAPTPDATQELGTTPQAYSAIIAEHNGVGFDTKYRTLIFKLFKHLNNEPKASKERTSG